MYVLLCLILLPLSQKSTPLPSEKAPTFSRLGEDKEVRGSLYFFTVCPDILTPDDIYQTSFSRVGRRWVGWVVNLLPGRGHKFCQATGGPRCTSTVHKRSHGWVQTRGVHSIHECCSAKKRKRLKECKYKLISTRFDSLLTLFFVSRKNKPKIDLIYKNCSTLHLVNFLTIV